MFSQINYLMIKIFISFVTKKVNSNSQLKNTLKSKNPDSLPIEKHSQIKIKKALSKKIITIFLKHG